MENTEYKTNLEEVEIGDVAYSICGPGEFADKDLCSRVGIVIKKETGRWGMFLTVKNIEGETWTVESLSIVGVGVYIKK